MSGATSLVSISMTRLNDSNYPEWAIRMEAVLVREGLWSLVKPTAEEKDKRTQEKMARTRAEIILRVEDNQLIHTISPDPMEIWLTLQRVHQATGFATSLSLRRKFLTAKKSDSQTMQAWIGQIQGLAFRMKHAKIDVTDQDTILAITMGLPIPLHSTMLLSILIPCPPKPSLLISSSLAYSTRKSGRSRVLH
jgi:hypothetical protein